MPSYTGSCHCGAVRFAFEREAPITSAYACDCTLCHKKNAAMTDAHESRFRILAGEEMLTLYQWNTGTARHTFCKRCGIYPFHKMRIRPDHYGINIFCIDGLDARAVPLTVFPGQTLSVKTG